MKKTIAFDVYGTLIDTHGVVTELQKVIGDRALIFSQAWREKQLEYSFRRGLMRLYEDFAICTQQALDYTCSNLNTPLTSQQKETLLMSYATLPAFDDVVGALSTLQESQHSIFAFSNGSAKAVEALLKFANINDYFDDIVSVDSLKTFKPNPSVYADFLYQSGATKDSAWLVSSNPFDVIGAISSGFSSAWIRRSPTVHFDPWGIEPTVTLNSLSELGQALKN